MPNLRLGLALSIAAVAIPRSLPAATRMLAIHPEREKLSAAMRRDAILADLEAILAGPAGPTSITSRPYVSTRNGLCRRDVVRLSYSPLKADKHGRPLKPVGVSVVTQYHFLGYEQTGTRDGWQKACEHLSAVNVYWAYSPDDTVAAFALATLDTAVADARKRQRVTVVCKSPDDGNAPAPDTDCTSEFLATASHVDSVSRCPGQTSTQIQCYGFRLDRYHVTIVTTYSKYGNEADSTEITMILNDEIILT